MDPRINGTLKNWNEGKGFGFITPIDSGKDIFVHISDYPKRGGQPKVGESLSFEVALNKDGKKKAVRVQRPGMVPEAPNRPRHRTPARHGKCVFGRIISLLFVVAIASAGYKFLAPKFNNSSSIPAAMSSGGAEEVSRFQCDGRTYCSQMTSCAEATFFIRNCSNTEMDGDGDGVPCESQWCTGFFAE